MKVQVAKKQKMTKEKAQLQSDLGATVRFHRRHLGITQEELAFRAEMHRTYIADIERGARNITLRSVANLARALQVSVEGLLLQPQRVDGSAQANASWTAHDTIGEVVLVEDRPEDAKLTVRAFGRAKLTNPVTVMPSGEDALAYVRSTGRHAGRVAPRIQLILLDLNLSRMPGLEVLRELKVDPRTMKIPVVVLTVSRADKNILECSRLGAEGYIVKPVDFDNFSKVTAKLDFHWALLGPGAGRDSNAQSLPHDQ